MLLKLNGPIAGNSFDGMAGDVVDWQNDGDCERLVKKGLATKATPAEIKSAEGKIRTYCPPKPTAADKWPPAPLKKLKRESDNDAA